MSALEGSITLEDVFTVVEGKRVPLAPELAGYLALEIADGTDAGGGAVDPRTVFVSEEGTVALVRPKNAPSYGDAEASVRVLLSKLLEASGSGTPALTTAARRKPGNGLPALVEELEAALIPVNRAAGRRALARLAREVKRVTLGLGRNASASMAPKPVTAAAPHARPVLRRKDSGAIQRPVVPGRSSESGMPARASASGMPARPRVEPSGFPAEEPGTAKRANEIEPLAEHMNDVDSARAESRAAPSAELASPRPVSVRPPATPSIPPPPEAKTSVVPPPPPPKREPTPPPLDVVPPAPAPPPLDVAPAAPAPPAPARGPFGSGPLGGDEVDNLLDAFNVSSEKEDRQVARELKAMAGLDPTPPPPDAQTLAELTKDLGRDLPRSRPPSTDGDGIEELLAMTDASAPVVAAPPPAAPAPPPVAPAPPAPAAAPRAAAAAPPEPARAEPPKPARRDDRAPPPSVRTKAEAAPKRPRDPRPRAPKTGMALLVMTLLVLVAATGAVWKFAPHVFTGRKQPAPSATVTASAAAPAPKCKLALALTDVPVNAEILLRVGQAPVDVERMPVGTRLELVATAEAHVPRRAVLKEDTVWEKGSDGKPRTEVPIQLDTSKAKPGVVEPWPPAEPGSQVGGSGPPGTVHVVSNVRGAEIRLLAGLGPEARIEQLRCDGDIEVLLAGPTTFRKRLRVSETEIAAAPDDGAGNRTVNVSAK